MTTPQDLLLALELARGGPSLKYPAPELAEPRHAAALLEYAARIAEADEPAPWIALPSVNPHFYVDPEFVGRLDANHIMRELYRHCDRRGRAWLTRIMRRNHEAIAERFV